MEKKELIATVDKLSGINTARISIKDSVVHPKYKKRYSTTSRFLVDTGGQQINIGDRVTIIETKPISKLKSWQIKSVISASQKSVVTKKLKSRKGSA